MPVLTGFEKQRVPASFHLQSKLQGEFLARHGSSASRRSNSMRSYCSSSLHSSCSGLSSLPPEENESPDAVSPLSQPSLDDAHGPLHSPSSSRTPCDRPCTTGALLTPSRFRERFGMLACGQRFAKEALCPDDGPGDSARSVLSAPLGEPEVTSARATFGPDSAPLSRLLARNAPSEKQPYSSPPSFPSPLEGRAKSIVLEPQDPTAQPERPAVVARHPFEFRCAMEPSLKLRSEPLRLRPSGPGTPGDTARRAPLRAFPLERLQGLYGPPSATAGKYSAAARFAAARAVDKRALHKAEEFLALCHAQGLATDQVLGLEEGELTELMDAFGYECTVEDRGEIKAHLRVLRAERSSSPSRPPYPHA